MAYSQCTPRCAFAQLDHPPPFHPDQLLHAQQGCADCLDQLIRQNEALIHWVLQRLTPTALSYEEALQAGRLGLWQALLHFEVARGFAFSSYAVVAIRRHIQRESQLEQRSWRPLPPITAEEGPSLLEQAHQHILRLAVQHCVGQLPPPWAQVVQRYYGLGQMQPQTQRALAQALGVTRQRIGQILQRARLLLALPVYSWPVRLQLERTSAKDIQAALRAWNTFRQGQRRNNQ